MVSTSVYKRLLCAVMIAIVRGICYNKSSENGQSSLESVHLVKTHSVQHSPCWLLNHSPSTLSNNINQYISAHILNTLQHFPGRVSVSLCAAQLNINNHSNDASFAIRLLVQQTTIATLPLVHHPQHSTRWRYRFRLAQSSRTTRPGQWMKDCW